MFARLNIKICRQSITAHIHTHTRTHTHTNTFNFFISFPLLILPSLSLPSLPSLSLSLSVNLCSKEYYHRSKEEKNLATQLRDWVRVVVINNCQMGSEIIFCRQWSCLNGKRDIEGTSSSFLSPLFWRLALAPKKKLLGPSNSSR